MEIFEGIGFSKFLEDDIAQLAPIVKRAFDEDTKRHLGLDSGGPSGYDNGDYIRRWYLKDDADAYKILLDGNLIGGICVSISSSGENYLTNIVIDPLCHDKGIGLIAWKYIEQKHPGTKIWKTETPGYSTRNHNFYINKCGFKVVKINNPNTSHASYALEKEMG